MPVRVGVQLDAGVSDGEAPADGFGVPVAVPASGNDLGSHGSLFREAPVGTRRDIRTEHVVHGRARPLHILSGQLPEETGHGLCNTRLLRNPGTFELEKKPVSWAACMQQLLLEAPGTPSSTGLTRAAGRG